MPDLAMKVPTTFLLGGDLVINRLGFGAMRLTGPGIWGPPQDKQEAIKILREAVKAGINFIDTADAYGPFINEETIAETLYPYPNGLVIATKGGMVRNGPGEWDTDGSAKHLREALEGSLKRLRLERIDLYQLHAFDPAVEPEESIGELVKLQKQGKIRHIGVSNVSVDILERIMPLARIVSVQNLYNVQDRKHEPVLEYCEKLFLAFIPWFPLGRGRLAQPQSPLAEMAKKHKATPARIALAWLLNRSPNTLPIPGTASLKHLQENLGATRITFDEEDMAVLNKIEQMQ